MSHLIKTWCSVYVDVGRSVFNGVKLTDRNWDRTYELAFISTVFGPVELELMTTSISHSKASQHLNQGKYFSFSVSPALQRQC